ncbi:hypothetical protein [Sphingorhabdus sp.]|jgi:hypothetical protein|uniref:hypothetical protein n=1 Tax=Sphingorhabdus sp. TaxID=1902408 RepID=UPI0037844F52
MARGKHEMSVIKQQLEAVRSQIERLQVKEETLVELLRELSGEPALVERTVRKRSPAVKPLVLDYMREVAGRGATTKEVDEAVKITIPTVAPDTVGSVLSRLKADGALQYVGERYYEKRFAPQQQPSPFDPQLRVII